LGHANRQAIIEDIYLDPRIPHAAYRPPFVKSLVMVPIRTLDSIGAIGIYWASHYHATPDQVETLQAMADATSVALENVQVYAQLEGGLKSVRRSWGRSTSNCRMRWLSACVPNSWCGSCP
jgi:GAF domain-containing protein